MNSGNEDYTFMDPSWKLPSLGNAPMYSGTFDISQSPPEPKLDSDRSTWNNTTNNSRYIPPNTNRGTYPPTANHETNEHFIQSGLPPAPSQFYQQPEEHFVQPGPSLPHSHQQPEQYFTQPGSSTQFYQQPEERFVQPGPPQPPPQFYQQPGEHFAHPGPPLPQSYRQPDERFMQPRPPQSYQQVGERSMPSGPPPPVQSHQQSGERYVPPGPPPQSYAHSHNQHRNNGNYTDSFEFMVDANSKDDYNMPKQPRNNGHSHDQNANRGHNFPPLPQPTQKRTQTIDHNHQAFFTDYVPSRDNHNSHHNHSVDINQFERKSKPRGNPANENKVDLVHSSVQRPNNSNIHEYLYGLAAPDFGSYVNTYQNQRRRLQDEKVNHKSVMNEYKSFLQNGGFGPAFGTVAQRTYEEKLDTEKKRKSYSKLVREINQQKIEEQKRIQNSGQQQRSRTYAATALRHRRPEELASHFLFTPEVKEFERKIKREHDANCKCSLHAKPFNTSP